MQPLSEQLPTRQKTDLHSSMADIHYIVSKLNAPPLNFNISLLSFSEKKPHELLAFLSGLCAKFTPKTLQKDASLESPEQTADRLAGLLRMVKYQHQMDPAEFKQLLAAGDRDVVYAVIKWVVAQGPVLEKRTFVGFYLSFPEMPEELLYDPQVIELREEIKGLQAEFIEAHKSLDAAQQDVKGLPQLRVQIKQMEEEKERLTDKVQKAAEQAAALPDAQGYRDVCVALRQEHDREVAISQQLMAQQQLLERAETACHRSAARLRDMQEQLQRRGGSSMDGDADGSRLLEVLQDDVARLRQQVSTSWPKELEAKQSRLAAVLATLNNGINTEADLQRLLSQESGLKQQVAAIQECIVSMERGRASDKAFLQVRQAQQMSSLVTRKKSEMTAKVQRLQERHDTLAAALDASGDLGQQSAVVVTEADWKAKYEMVRSQLPAYRFMKAELTELESEVYALQQKEEGLCEQCLAGTADTDEPAASSRTHQESLRWSVRDSLERAGTGGFGQDGDAAGGGLDSIAAAIKLRKAQLAPAIQELRSLRQQQQELEAVHAEKKAVYDAALGGLEGCVAQLQGSVTQLQKEVEAASSELDKTRGRVRDLEGLLQRMQAIGAEELRRRCQAQLLEAESSLSKLRGQQRHAEERSSYGQAQLGMMEDLLQVLQLKQQLSAAAGAAAANGPSKAAGRAALLATGRWAPGGVAATGFNTNVMVLI